MSVILVAARVFGAHAGELALLPLASPLIFVRLQPLDCLDYEFVVTRVEQAVRDPSALSVAAPRVPEHRLDERSAIPAPGAAVRVDRLARLVPVTIFALAVIARRRPEVNLHESAWVAVRVPLAPVKARE